jgi:hypothetical protein
MKTIKCNPKSSVYLEKRVLQYILVCPIVIYDHYNHLLEPGSSVSIVSDYGAGRPFDRGTIPGRGKGFFLCPVSRPALGPTQPPVQWVPGVLSPGDKTRPGRDADHSPPSSAEVKNE